MVKTFQLPQAELNLLKDDSFLIPKKQSSQKHPKKRYEHFSTFLSKKNNHHHGLLSSVHEYKKNNNENEEKPATRTIDSAITDHVYRNLSPRKKALLRNNGAAQGSFVDPMGKDIMHLFNRYNPHKVGHDGHVFTDPQYAHRKINADWDHEVNLHRKLPNKKKHLTNQQVRSSSDQTSSVTPLENIQKKLKLSKVLSEYNHERQGYTTAALLNHFGGNQLSFDDSTHVVLQGSRWNHNGFARKHAPITPSNFRQIPAYLLSTNDHRF